MERLPPGMRAHLTRGERLVGWFVSLTGLGLVAGFAVYLWHVAERKGTFEPRAYYQTSINNAAGLRVGDPVMMMGFDVGEITAVIPNGPWDHFNVTIEFFVRQGGDNKYYGYIWTDSKAKIASANLLGNRFIEITKGKYGLPTVIQRGDSGKELRRLNVNWEIEQRKEKFKRGNDKAGLKAFEEKLKSYNGIINDWWVDQHRDTLANFQKWQQLSGLNSNAAHRADIDMEFWSRTSGAAKFGEFKAEEITVNWTKAATANSWSEPDPKFEHLAAALAQDDLDRLFPHEASLPGGPANPKVYYLESEESKALGDVITEVTDQISTVVGKDGAIGDLVINDDIRPLLVKLGSDGGLGDMIINKEIEPIIQKLDAVADRIATEEGYVGNLILNDELKLTIDRVNAILHDTTNVLGPLTGKLAEDAGSGGANDLHVMVADFAALMKNLKGVTGEVDKQLAANPDLVKEGLEIANAMKDLASTIETTLGTNPDLVNNLSKLTAEIDGFMQLLSRHWLFRKAAEMQAGEMKIAWDSAHLAILRFGALVEAFKMELNRQDASAGTVRPRLDDLTDAAAELSTRSDKVVYLVTDNPSRTVPLSELAQSATRLRQELHAQFERAPGLQQNVAGLARSVSEFVAVYEKNPIVREARSRTADAGPESKKTSKKRSFWGSRGSRNRDGK